MKLTDLEEKALMQLNEDFFVAVERLRKETPNLSGDVGMQFGMNVMEAFFFQALCTDPEAMKQARRLRGLLVDEFRQMLIHATTKATATVEVGKGAKVVQA